MIAQHHVIVNQVRFRRRKPPRNTTRIQQLGNTTNDYLARIKRPLLALKERIVKKQVFDININTRLSSSKEADAKATAVSTTHREGLDKPALEVAAPVLSLDPHMSNIPAEIRLNIWRMCWEPRTVEVHPYINDRELDDIALFASTTFRSTTPPPATLHICSESRIETLKYYSLVFAARSKFPEVYFNFDLDRLYIREADMFRGLSFATTFSARDLKRIRHLAISDRYIQYLMGERQRNPSPQNDIRSLACLLLQSKGRNHMSGVNIWESLEQLDIVIDNKKGQRDDRICSWIREGIFVCAHCVLVELKASFDQWPDGPRPTIKACASSFRRVQMNSETPEIGKIIQRNGHLIFSPCCRLRPGELLEALRRLENPPDRPQWVSVVRILGLQIGRYPGSLPCRCRLENYILSEGLSPYGSRFYAFNRRDGGELGRLCKKWLRYTPFIEPR